MSKTSLNLVFKPDAKISDCKKLIELLKSRKEINEIVREFNILCTANDKSGRKEDE